MRKTRGKRRQKRLEEKRARYAQRHKERKKQESITTEDHITIGEDEED